MDLFATQETSHCTLWFSLTHPAPLGLDAMAMAEAVPVCFSPDCSAPGSSRESLPGSSRISSPLLAGPFMVCGSASPTRRLYIGDSRPSGSPLTDG